MRTSRLTILTISMFVALFCLPALGQVRDELRLRNGAVISGQAVTHDDNTVVFRGPDGIKTYPRAEVSMIVFGAAASTGGLPPGLSAGPGMEIKRWYTWRRVLDNPRDGTSRQISLSKLSGNGQKIVTCGPQGVHTLNPDGSASTQLSSTATYKCDITADGRRVVWFNDKDAFAIANSDGSGRAALPGGFNVQALRITGSGNAIYVLDRNKDGIFRVAPDGSDIRRVLATEPVAKMNTVDTNANHWRDDSIDVSDDGRHIVFHFLWDAFAYDVERSQLRQLTQYLRPENRSFQFVRVSPDGSKLAFHYGGDGVPMDQHTITVQDWNGSVIATHSKYSTGSMRNMQVLSDGTVFGGGNTVRFFRPDGRTREEVLEFGEGGPIGNPYSATVSADGRRMVLLSDGVASTDQGRGTQIHVIESNPPSISGFPSLTNIAATPRFLLTDGSTNAAVAAGAQDPAGLNMVFGFLTRPNMLGHDVNIARNGGYLYDNASHGDAKANDNTYTNNEYKVGQVVVRPVEAGPFVLRVFARNQQGHMTVVDVEGMEARRP